MDQKTALTEAARLRLTAAYLNMNDEGQALLDTATEQLTEQEKREKGREKKEEEERANESE